MKKLILAATITSILCVSASAFAAPTPETVDSSSAKISWVSKVPLIIPGQYVTFTGDGGQPTITDGDLTIKANGEFTSSTIKLELRYYDAETGDVGAGVIVGENVDGDSASAKSITYTVANVVMTSTYGVELSGVGVDITLNGKPISPNVPDELTEATAWQTEWSITNSPASGITKVIPGDQITAATVVYADVSFTDPA